MSAVFPGAVATNADLIVAGNNDSSTLAVNLTAVDTTLVFVSSGIFSTSQAVVIGSEIILLGTVAGAIATGCLRGYAGTTAATHSVGDTAQDLVIASHHNNMKDEVIAIEAALGANLSKAGLGLFADSFDFTLSPAAALSAGIPATVTLSTMPAGINAYSPNKHYLRITDPVSVAETVLITARTATTITFTPAYSHVSGNWSISSATSGIQEAGNVGPSIQVRVGTWPMFAQARFSYAVNMQGAGEKVTILSPQTATMNVLLGQNALTVSDLGVISAIAYQTAGSCFSLVDGGGIISAINIRTDRCFTTVNAVSFSGGMGAYMHNCQCNGVVGSVLFYSSAGPGLVRMTSVYADGRYYNSEIPPVISVCNTAGAVVTRTSGSFFTGLVSGGIVVINNVQYTILTLDSANQITLTSSAGVQAGVTFKASGELLAPKLVWLRGTLAGGIFSDLWFQAAQIHVLAESSAAPVNECVFTNCIFDQDSYSSLAAISAFNSLNIASISSNSLRFNGCYIATFGYGIIGQYQANMSLCDSKVVAFGIAPAVTLADCLDISITDNSIRQECSLGVTYPVNIGGAVNARISIQDNIFETIAGVMARCVRDVSAASTDVVIKNNVCNSPVSLFIDSASVPSLNTIVSGNQHSGANITIVSAATITLPVYNQEDLVTITGVVGINTIVGGRNNRQAKFFIVNGLTFAAGASIANTVVAPAASVVTASYDSTSARWYLK